MVFSSCPTPEINAIFNQQNCANYFGKVRVANPTLAGGICQVQIWYLAPVPPQRSTPSSTSRTVLTTSGRCGWSTPPWLVGSARYRYGIQLLPHSRDQCHLQPAELCQLLREGAGGQPHPGWWDLPGTDMVFSSSPTPEINAIFNQQNCANYFGKVRVANPTLAGGICQVHIWYLSPQKYIQANSQRIIVFFAQKIVTKLKTMGLGSGI